jgi:parvulin-like peptidyl-prolyl isomerase
MIGRAKIVMLTLVAVALAGSVVAVTLGMQRGTVVAATVNGEVIYVTELDGEVNAVAKQYGIDLGSPEGARQRPEITRVVLDQLIEQRLVLQEARRFGALPNEAQVELQLQEIKRTFPTETDFATALAQRHLTLPDLKTRLRTAWAARNLMVKVAPVTVPETEIDQYFRAHRNKFDRPEQVHVKHILLADEPQARLVLAKLRRGEPFDDLARQYSKDPGSRERGGDLGFVSRGQLVPEFEQVAFTLQPKQISDIVKTQYGYHLIQVLERRPPQPATLDQVRDQVRDQLQTSKQDAAFQAWLQQVKAQAKITRLDLSTK